MIPQPWIPHLLTILIALPIAGAAFVALTRRESEGLQKLSRLAVSIVTFLVSIPLVTRFTDTAAYQFEVKQPWIPAWGISYHVGIDGLSLWLVILTTFLTPLCLLGSWRSIETRVREFVVFMLLLEAGMIGVFVALDLFLFYVFWEAMLIPMYFLIGIWGHDRRIYAAVKFFLYTFAGSVLMLVAFLVLLVICAVFAPLIAPYDPAAQSLADRLTPPAWMDGGSWSHVLGTDNLGVRDDKLSVRGPAPGFVTGGPNKNYSGDARPPGGSPHPNRAYRDWNDQSAWTARTWEITESSIGYQGPYVALVAAFAGARGE